MNISSSILNRVVLPEFGAPHNHTAPLLASVLKMANRMNELIKSWIGPCIENVSQVLNSQLINIDNFFHQGLSIQNFLKIDEKKYKNYLDQYIKVPNSPDLPIWEIFTNQIKNKQNAGHKLP